MMEQALNWTIKNSTKWHGFTKNILEKFFWCVLYVILSRMQHVAGSNPPQNSSLFKNWLTWSLCCVMLRCLCGVSMRLIHHLWCISVCLFISVLHINVWVGLTTFMYIYVLTFLWLKSNIKHFMSYIAHSYNPLPNLFAHARLLKSAFNL